MNSKLQNHSRGYLPHILRPGASYFVTFRLADSLPKAVVDRLEAELSSGSSPDNLETERRRRIEHYLDSGSGSCSLRDPRIAEITSTALKFFHGERYRLDEWVVMPNHVHAIVRPIGTWSLSAIVQSWKRYSAREANRTLQRTGEQFWQTETFDRVIRNADEKLRVQRYIRHNPVTAGLCAEEHEWRWSSASWKQNNSQKPNDGRLQICAT
jgi:REP element-mobilizing transposase RayT